MAIGMAGAAAHGQNTNAPVAAPNAAGSTNAPASTQSSGTSTNVTQLGNVTVVGRLDTARNQIVPDLGASVYTVSKTQIANVPGGDAAAFNQVLLRTPGMVEDSAVNGDLHLRGEHANVQYRINDVLLPEGVSSFGEELDTRFVDSLRLITGSLPAQYGFRTAGVVDIHTKSGAFEPGGEASIYGGSFETIAPSFEYGGSEGKFNYFVNGSFEHNALGIENPTASYTAIHDRTEQGKAFTYMSYVLDDTSRVSIMGSASYSTFQIPNEEGIVDTPAVTSAAGGPAQPASFDKSTLNENQIEQNYYGVIAYQKSLDDLNLQVAGFGRSSSAHFFPDSEGDLFLNGVASEVDRTIYSGGVQTDASYNAGDKNTVRAGFQVLQEDSVVDTTTTAFNLNGAGEATSVAVIQDDSSPHALFAGVYLQDEWKIVPQVTLNAGGRMDFYDSSFDNENQFCPRANVIYTPTDTTTLHAGYAHYFTPPPLENVSSGTVSKFNGTSAQPAIGQNSPVQAERADYFDAGVRQTVAQGLQVGVDGYLKFAKNQLDDGLFGQTQILSSFNYAQGQIDGVEFTATYGAGGFSAYANFAISDALGNYINSAQFLFDPATLNYSQTQGYVHLDHAQWYTGSFGTSYRWDESHSSSTTVYADALYGSGLRQDFLDSTGALVVPNGSTVPEYYSVSLGAEQSFRLSKKQYLKARLDAVNITDNVYQLRSGTGIGVNAPQYGQRFGLFGTVSYVF